MALSLCFYGEIAEGNYRKVPKFSDARNIAVITLISNKLTYSREMPPKDADGIANSEDPDQTAPLGAV